jgi:cell division protein FtsQ
MTVSTAPTRPVADPEPTPLRPRGGRRRRRWLRVLLVVLVAGLVVFGAWAVWFSPWLTVQRIEVVGVGGERADTARAAAAVALGVPLARVDTGRSEEAVRALPWVESVEVRRGWPTQVVIAVSARTPVAVVSGVGERSAVDAEGAVFEVTGSLPAGLPRVEAEGPALTAAVEVLGQLPADLARRVRAVTATTRDDVTLQLRSGDQVRWGSSEQAEFKAEVLRALLNRKAEVYDVSAPELPTTFRPR